MRTRWFLLLIAVVLVLGACGGDDESSTSEAPDSGTEEEAEDGGGTADLADLDRCSLLTEADVQALTGVDEEFDDSGGGDSCFWAVPVPGFGSYVEITVRPAGGLGSGSPVGGCAGSPVAGVGEEAVGGTCPGTQEKVFLAAYEDGVYASVLVNDPQRALSPADLEASVQAALAEA